MAETSTNTAQVKKPFVRTYQELIKLNPVLTPKEATMGMLKVVKALSEGAILSPELIKEQTNIVLMQHKERKEAYQYSYELNDDWSYTYLLNTGKSAFFDLEFYSNHRETHKPDMATICEIDVDFAHQYLLATGLTYLGERRTGHLNKRYNNNHYIINIAYWGESKENPVHACIFNMRIRKLQEK